MGSRSIKVGGWGEPLKGDGKYGMWILGGGMGNARVPPLSPEFGSKRTVDLLLVYLERSLAAVKKNAPRRDSLGSLGVGDRQVGAGGWNGRRNRIGTRDGGSPSLQSDAKRAIDRSMSGRWCSCTPLSCLLAHNVFSGFPPGLPLEHGVRVVWRLARHGMYSDGGSPDKARWPQGRRGFVPGVTAAGSCRGKMG